MVTPRAVWWRQNKNHFLTGPHALFLEQYKLESNPFVADAARPVFASHSMRYAALKLEDLINKQIYCLFLSGPAGAGKGTLTRQRFTQLRNLSAAWIDHSCETREQFAPEAARPTSARAPSKADRRSCGTSSRCFCDIRRRTVVSATSSPTRSNDSRRRYCASSKWLAQLRLRNKPIVFFLVLTRNEELVANLLPQYDGGPWARAAHQRLSGFTLDETRAYVRTCLRGAGCDWAEELMPDDVIVDIQAFTQGVVGDTNALCRAALDAVAARSTGGNRQPRVTRALLKEIGMALNLRYDASAWVQPTEETLVACGCSPERSRSAARSRPLD